MEAALAIPKGRVTTYGRIARAAGGGARSITSILAKAYRAGETHTMASHCVRKRPDLG